MLDDDPRCCKRPRRKSLTIFLELLIDPWKRLPEQIFVAFHRAANHMTVGLTLLGRFPRTMLPALPLSVNHLPGGVLILAVAAAFRQRRPWRLSRTVVIGSDSHLVLLLPAADSPSQGDRPAGARRLPPGAALKP